MRIRIEASGSISRTFSIASACTQIVRVSPWCRDARLQVVDVVGGGGVDPSWVGRDVFALTRFGGYPDGVCVPQAQVFPDLQACPEEGAAIPINYLTAWNPPDSLSYSYTLKELPQ